jgi:GNAT superfamily N-acetyltransferase
MNPLGNLTIRGMKPGDLEEIKQLLAEREDYNQKKASERSAMMAWVAFHNPYIDNQEVTYFVAEANGHIIAYHGRMPVIFNIKGTAVKAYHLHDLYVQTEYRKQGLGFWITLAFAEAIEQNSNSFFCLLGMNELNLLIQRRMGYFETSTHKYVKLLNSEEKISNYVRSQRVVRLLNRIGQFILDLTDQVILQTPNGENQVIRILEFDKRFDQLEKRLAKKLKISTIKSSSYLNWKYVHRPYKREEIFAVINTGKIKGFIVVSESPYKKKVPTGVIVDLLADPKDKVTLSLLIQKAIEYFKTKGMHKIHCLVTELHYAKALRKHLFIKQPGKAFMLGSIDSFDDPEFLKIINNWNLTYGESDAYMLSR